ncbi:uncharacterized protein F4812DRAFT_409840 [Daldinia caldariorum]|uniref:uncharacterized protein n=1 Tax=Daldinia caldariorum TaxID=326644 RepID=UPI002007587B|nr:uncharacterized protein F4812DRAFT_409840 [Daldinia caldariorum]KAI1472672.1 hypothetical protein F4812DRAFT_409840 [Daldinia caldariorum]
MPSVGTYSSLAFLLLTLITIPYIVLYNLELTSMNSLVKTTEIIGTEILIPAECRKQKPFFKIGAFSVHCNVESLTDPIRAESLGSM